MTLPRMTKPKLPFDRTRYADFIKGILASPKIPAVKPVTTQPVSTVQPPPVVPLPAITPTKPLPAVSPNVQSLIQATRNQISTALNPKPVTTTVTGATPSVKKLEIPDTAKLSADVRSYEQAVVKGEPFYNSLLRGGQVSTANIKPELPKTPTFGERLNTATGGILPSLTETWETMKLNGQQDKNPVVRFMWSPIVGDFSPNDILGVAMGVKDIADIGMAVKSITAFSRLPQVRALNDFAKTRNISKGSPEYQNMRGVLQRAYGLHKMGASEAANDLMTEFNIRFLRATVKPAVSTAVVAKPQLPSGIRIVPTATQTGAMAMGGKAFVPKTGEEIAKVIGVKFDAIQERVADIPESFQFTDPQTGSTFLARTLEEAKTKLATMREKFAKAPPVSLADLQLQALQTEVSKIGGSIQKISNTEFKAVKPDGTSQVFKDADSAAEFVKGEKPFKEKVPPTPQKEPWQMTLKEAITSMGKDADVLGKNTIKTLHKTQIQKAIAEGKPVSPEVLKDYPDLQTPQKPSPIPEKTPLDTMLERLEQPFEEWKTAQMESGIPPTAVLEPSKSGAKPPSEPPQTAVATGGEGEPFSVKQYTKGQIDALSGMFGDYLSNPSVENAWQLTQELRHEFRSQQASDLKEAAKRLMKDKNLTAEQSIKQAIQEVLSKRLPTLNTDYFKEIESELRDVLFLKVYNELKNEPFELASTKTALDNALAGKPIPSEPGVKGGSALSRLQRVFGGQPKLMEGIKKISEEKKPLEKVVEGIFHETGRDPIPSFTEKELEYLRNLKPIGSQQTLGVEIPGEGQGMFTFAPTGKLGLHLSGQQLELASKIKELDFERVNWTASPITDKEYAQMLTESQRIEAIAGKKGKVLTAEQKVAEKLAEEVRIKEASEEAKKVWEWAKSVPADELAKYMTDKQLEVAISSKFTPAEHKFAFQSIQLQRVIDKNPDLGLLTDIAANPNPSEAVALGRVKQLSMIPPSKVHEVYNMLRKVGINLVDALGLPKALKFAFDISYPGRQGLFLGIRHPISWARNFKPMMQALQNEKVAIELDHLLKTDSESMQAIEKLGLDLYDVTQNAPYMKRPEAVTSRLAEKYVPGVRQSGRAGAVFMNKLMVDVGKHAMKTLGKLKADTNEYKAFGEYINWAAGRGTIPGKLNEAARVLNDIFTSPRWFFSRIQLPFKVFSSSPAVRKEVLQTLFAFLGLGALVLSIGKMAGAEVETDPRSADAFKLKINNKRIDWWIGYAQMLRFIAQVSTGEVKTREGKIIKTTRSEIISRYLQSKESPGIGMLITLLSGKNFVGEKVDFSNTKGWLELANETFTPAAVEEMINAYREEGTPQSVGVSGIGLVGVGVSTYGGALPLVPQMNNELSKIGTQRTEDLEKALEEAKKNNASSAKIAEIKARDWTYDITTLRDKINTISSKTSPDQRTADKGFDATVPYFWQYQDLHKQYESNISESEKASLLKDNPNFQNYRVFWGYSTAAPSDLKTAQGVSALATKFGIPLSAIPAFQKTESGKEKMPSNQTLWKPYFDYYALPGTGGYLGYSQKQVDEGELPEKYLKDWTTYQKLSDAAKTIFRKSHPDASKDWRTDFRRKNPEFDKWLVEQERNKPLQAVSVSVGSRPRSSRTTISAPSTSVGVSVSSRGKKRALPKFKKFSVKTSTSISAPKAPKV